MDIPRCKGTQDLLPRQMRKFRRVKQVFRNHCEKWGYGEIRTPTLEYLHLFTSAGTLTPGKLRGVYSFLDWDGWSGERVVLRPDGTIPSARLFVQNMPETELARLYYIENMFSFEGTGQESRERWQCGVELLGDTAPEGDAELIMLGLEILKDFNLKPITVKLSHMGLIKKILTEMGLSKQEQEERLEEILDRDPKTLKMLLSQPEEIRRFIDLLVNMEGTSKGFLGNVKSVLPPQLSHLRVYLDEMAEMARLLDKAGQDYQIDFSAGKGFEYYTGMVFTLYGSGQLVGKGGRYDELLELVGDKKMPASGFALLLDKIMELIPDIPQAANRILLKRSSRKIESLQAAFAIAGRIRELGYVVETDSYTGDEANRRGTIVIADDLKSFTLTDQSTGKSSEDLSADALIALLGESR